MKKLFLILALGIAFVSKSYSQSWNTVGNSVAGTDYMGGNLSSTAPLLIKMRANYGLNFFSNDLERMRILNTGEVGIGTSTPASWLHVDAGSSAEVFRTSTTSAIAR